MGGRGADGLSPRAQTDAEETDVPPDAADPALADPGLAEQPAADTPPADQPPPEHAETDPADTAHRNWSPDTAAWDGNLYDAIEQLGGRDDHGSANWVGLADLRPLLGGTREEQDANLQRLERDRVISLVPNSARFNLTDADHAAAIEIGGEANHLVQWEYLGCRHRPQAAP